jgi:two-component system, OmpR family, sensor kinase
LLEAAGATVAILAGCLGLVRWRLSGEARPLWLGAALIWFGTLTVGVAALLPAIQPTALDPRLLDSLRAGSRLAVIAALIYAALGSEVDARLRRRHAFMPLALATALGAALVQVPALAPLLGGATEQAVGGADRALGSAVLVALWLGGALLHLWIGIRGRRPLHAWTGLMMAGLGMAEISRIVLLGDADLVWSAMTEVLRVLALLCGVAGVTVELQQSFAEQRGNLMRSMVSALTAEARIRAELAEQEERAHEARNALSAIEGATKTLERYREQLPPETREELATAVSAEIARLQRLVAKERLGAQHEPFDVQDALLAVLTGARAQGMLIETEWQNGLRAHGRAADTAQVVDNLLTNARRYAPASPVRIACRMEGGRVVLRVEDRGPGVDAAEREAIFQRGQRGTNARDAAGSGLGLYVSAQLMREQGGDLWVDEREGGGASFALALPRARESDAEALPEPG